VTVFELAAADSAVALHCAREGDYGRVHALGAQAIDASQWEPLRVRYIRDGSAGADPSDLVMLGVEPAFTARAVEQLADVLFACGQILPLRSDDGEFYLWNVTNVVDALDEARSSLSRFSTGRIMMVDKWSFHSKAVEDHAAFKIPQLPRAYTFVTQAFVDRVRSADLKGFDPRVVWTAFETV
jgi:hypothetical protein